MQDTNRQVNLESLESIVAGPAVDKEIEKELERLMTRYSGADLETLCQFLLQRTRGSRLSTSSQLYLQVVVTEANARHFVGVPANICVDDFVQELVHRFDLETTGPDGQTISYHLAMRRKSGDYQMLLSRPTLYQQEVEPGCDVVLLPEISS